MNEKNQPPKQEQAIQYVRTLLQPLSRFPEDIQISFTIDERGLLLDLDANDRDLSAIIGKNGINAWSLRNLMRLWGQRNDAIVKLLIKGRGSEFYKPLESRSSVTFVFHGTANS